MIDDRTDPHPRKRRTDLPTQAEVKAARSPADRFLPGEYGRNLRVRKTANPSKTAPPPPETDWKTCDECCDATDPAELKAGLCKRCRREARDRRR